MGDAASAKQAAGAARNTHILVRSWLRARGCRLRRHPESRRTARFASRRHGSSRNRGPSSVSTDADHRLRFSANIEGTRSHGAGRVGLIASVGFVATYRRQPKQKDDRSGIDNVRTACPGSQASFTGTARRRAKTILSRARPSATPLKPL